ncbi:Membrane-associated protein Hem [Hypsibius exemplaris]|uniref:Membrane-associated protein Hem n=1 Tax=Hypsibius exemplaris TaxID=2072580 RepID=A0A1W0WD90_HYPEX|nr:Membrane-associated protein Hem [Hypsibius exemplaris]
MARSLMPGHQKLAEKLTVLNDRGQGMLTRLYNIRKACLDVESKPKFLYDPKLEPAVKHVEKKFPAINAKSSGNVFGYLSQIRSDVQKNLSIYYETFVDILDFKDHVSELLTTMDACQVTLDITCNFDVTVKYLELIAKYVSLMIILSRVDDRKAMLGLYTAVHELANGQCEPSFPRLGQMILDYEMPLRKLCEDFVPHNRILSSALLSLQKVYSRRNLPADQWRSHQLLSLTSKPADLSVPAYSDTTACEYLGLEVMERWIIIGFTLCHTSLNQPVAMELWSQALHTCWIMTLFRDEVIAVQHYLQTYFESIKGLNKRVTELRDSYIYAQQNSVIIHKDRRLFLRIALKELNLLFADQPGLLGPKALLALMALSMARDEISWLIRHFHHQDLAVPMSKEKKQRGLDEMIDRHLPELLFLTEQLRELIRRHGKVIQSYHIQFLGGFDATKLNHLMQNVSALPEDENAILSSLCNSLGELSRRKTNSDINCDTADLRDIRLDWFRVQASASSIARNSFILEEHQDMTHHLNTVMYHTRLVDDLDNLLEEVSDLSLCCFYAQFFQEQFTLCLEFPAQTRYIIAFPLICGHFMAATHELCPEERSSLGNIAVGMANAFLDEMGKEVKNIIFSVCDEQCVLADQLLPRHGARVWLNQVAQERKTKKSKAPPVQHVVPVPGQESYRRSREDLTTYDKLHMALTELCFSINYSNSVVVWEHMFCPKEFLVQQIENALGKVFVDMTMCNAENNYIVKPSELLVWIQTYMNTLQTLENYVQVDMSRVFNAVMLQQTQPTDSQGHKTITALYTTWYLDTLLRRVTAGHIVFSPLQKAFVAILDTGAQAVRPEDYANLTELRALAELIGPYGMKYLYETLTWNVASQIGELKKIVLQNGSILMELRTSFDKPDNMRELSRRLQNADSLLHRMILIGTLLHFRSLCQEPLNDAVKRHVPYLYQSIDDFKDSNLTGDAMMLINEMLISVGIEPNVDAILINSIRAQKGEKKESVSEEDHQFACLLMVFLAVSLPRLARLEEAAFNIALEAHYNNMHCMGKAVNVVLGAMFYLCGRGDTVDRLREFLALASSSLLRLATDTDKEAIKNRDSTYLLLEYLVKESPYLTQDLFEACFPQALFRTAFQAVHRTDRHIHFNNFP